MFTAPDVTGKPCPKCQAPLVRIPDDELVERKLQYPWRCESPDGHRWTTLGDVKGRLTGSRGVKLIPMSEDQPVR